MELTLSIDASSEIPLHKQIYEEYRAAILSGRLAAGAKVPSSRALSKSLGVSRATATMAYDCLASEGYLTATTGSGTFVSSELPEDLLSPSSPDSGMRAETSFVEAAREGTTSSTFKKRRLSWFGSSLEERQWLGYEQDEPEIQFVFGRPDISEFPMRIWNQLLLHHARKRSLNLLDSPANAHGHQPLREAIAQYLGRARALRCDAGQVIVVNGSQQAIDLVTRVLVDRDDSVCLEEPGYIGAKKAFEAQGARLVPVPVDANGLMIDFLNRRSQDVRPQLVYVTPSHQFPTGSVLSLPRRLELIAWARRNDVYIIEDDYDSEFRYSGRPIPALAGFDHGGSVIYIGTFSKVLLPALRIGYLVVPADLVDVFSRAKWLADRHSPLLEQQVLADFIQLGHLERHIRRMRGAYESKRKLVLKLLKDLCGDRLTVYGDNAGINVLVRLKVEADSGKIIEYARQRGVGLALTSQFYLNEPPRGEFLLNYGGLSEEDIERGLKIFVSAVIASS